MATQENDIQQPEQKGGSSTNYEAILADSQAGTEAKTKPANTEAKMLGLDIQPWHDRAEELKKAGTRIIAVRGAGSVNGIDPGEADRAVALLQEKVAGLVEAGTPVALMYDGDGDSREKPDVGAVFGKLADAFKDNPSVTALAAQTEGWYGEPDNGPIKSATGTPFETYVFDDGLPGAHDSLTQSPALVEYSGYEQVYVGPVGPIAEKQLGDVSTKAALRDAEAGPVPVSIIETKNNAALDQQLQAQLEAAADDTARAKVQAKITQRESQPYGAFFTPDGELALDKTKYPAISFDVVKPTQ
jgi:hypothetical protein